MHYFSPVQKMELLEIVKHSNTSKEAIGYFDLCFLIFLASAVYFGKKQGKVCIVVNVFLIINFII